jgi:hypothetical protein
VGGQRVWLIVCSFTRFTISRAPVSRGEICRLRLGLGKRCSASSIDGQNRESSTTISPRCNVASIVSPSCSTDRMSVPTKILVVEKGGGRSRFERSLVRSILGNPLALPAHVRRRKRHGSPRFERSLVRSILGNPLALPAHVRRRKRHGSPRFERSLARSTSLATKLMTPMRW